MGLIADATTDLQAIHIRQHEVQDNQVKGFLLGALQTLTPVSDMHHITIHIRQMHLNQTGNILVVFDNEYVF